MIGGKLQRRLDEIGMGQAELARRSGLSSGHIADLVHNKRGKQLTLTTLQKLCEALEVGPDFFYPELSQLRAIHSHRRKRRVKQHV